MPADGGGGDGLIRLGLSQRVDVLDERDERRDCLDQRWQPLFAGLGAMIIPLPNLDTVPENLVDGLGLNGIVLTGGNDVGGTPGATNVAPERDKFEHALITLCLQRSLPLLGICRGMQMINMVLGGGLARTTGHAGVSHDISVQDGSPWSNLWPNPWRVNSYHDVCIPMRSLAPSLQCLARSEAGDVEAFIHENGKCHGIMWHPEREMPPRGEDLNYLATVLEL